MWAVPIKFPFNVYEGNKCFGPLVQSTEVTAVIKKHDQTQANDAAQ